MKSKQVLLASDYGWWTKYVDFAKTITEAEFYAMDMEEKIELVMEMLTDEELEKINLRCYVVVERGSEKVVQDWVTRHDARFYIHDLECADKHYGDYRPNKYAIRSRKADEFEMTIFDF